MENNKIRVIILNDDCSDISVFYENDTHNKTFSSFINEMAFSHSNSYIMKTVHCEDLESERARKAFAILKIADEIFPDATEYFDTLWNSDELGVVDGADVY